MFEQKNEDLKIPLRSPSKLGSLIGILLILAAVSVYTFYSKSLSENVSQIKTSVSKTNNEIEEIKVNLEGLRKAESELDLSTEVERLEAKKSIPVGISQDDAIRDIMNITDEYDIDLKSISFGKGISKKEGIGVLRINSSFEGNYSDLVNFLEGIEQNARFFKVASISVQINELDILDIKRATFSLSIEAFFQT